MPPEAVVLCITIAVPLFPRNMLLLIVIAPLVTAMPVPDPKSMVTF